MEKINITEKLEEFYRHLSAADVDRTIFSAKFGDGKTEFLHQFKEKYSDEYTFYTLYPVNYQIAPNEQIMEYIKRDLLFQLILNGTLTPIDNIPDHILIQWYLHQKWFDILTENINLASRIGLNISQFGIVIKGISNLIKSIKKQCKKFDEFKKEITKENFEKATNIIENLSEGAGNIYELDPISWLIAQSIAKQDRKPVLIIEDLDRIDPAHLFRILNIFSAHIARHYLCSDKTIFQDDEEEPFDKLPNKFGFDKIIFIMDADATRSVFNNFYGNSNYEGYISKFFSKYIFYYSIIEDANQNLYFHVMGECLVFPNTFFKALQAIKFELEQKSVRDIAKVLDNFKAAYRKEKIEVTEDFCFFSDTPLVKLLATLRRLGVNRNQLSEFLKAIEPKEMFIKLLGCFAIDKESTSRNGKIYYRGAGYQMLFYKDQDGYKLPEKVELLGNISPLEIDEFFEIEVDRILEKALRYVN